MSRFVLTHTPVCAYYIVEKGRAVGTTQDTPDSRGIRSRPAARRQMGAAGERLAAQLFERRGLRVVARNWRCPYGEIDLIVEDGAELVFVEVKTRRGSSAGTPEEAITPLKRRRLITAAQTYLAEHNLEEHLYRIDVVAVDLLLGGRVQQVRHHRRAIAEE